MCQVQLPGRGCCAWTSPTLQGGTGLVLLLGARPWGPQTLSQLCHLTESPARPHVVPSPLTSLTHARGLCCSSKARLHSCALPVLHLKSTCVHSRQTSVPPPFPSRQSDSFLRWLVPWLPSCVGHCDLSSGPASSPHTCSSPRRLAGEEALVAGLFTVCLVFVFDGGRPPLSALRTRAVFEK